MTTGPVHEGYRYWVSYTLQSLLNGRLIHKTQQVITTVAISSSEQLHELEQIILEQMLEYADGSLPEDIQLNFTCWPMLLESVENYSEAVDQLKQHNETKDRIKGERPKLTLVKD